METFELIGFDLFCSKCKYNLRSLPTHGLCPECGQPIPFTLVAGSGEVGHSRANECTRILDLLQDRAIELSGVSTEAVEFISQAMNNQLWPGSHCDARALCVLVRRYAEDCFGTGGKRWLREAGLVGSEEIGKVVFALVDCGLLEKGPNDKRADFDGIFTLDSLFEGE